MRPRINRSPNPITTPNRASVSRTPSATPIKKSFLTMVGLADRPGRPRGSVPRSRRERTAARGRVRRRPRRARSRRSNVGRRRRCRCIRPRSGGCRERSRSGSRACCRAKCGLRAQTPGSGSRNPSVRPPATSRSRRFAIVNDPVSTLAVRIRRWAGVCARRNAENRRGRHRVRRGRERARRSPAE